MNSRLNLQLDKATHLDKDGGLLMSRISASRKHHCVSSTIERILGKTTVRHYITILSLSLYIYTCKDTADCLNSQVFVGGVLYLLLPQRAHGLWNTHDVKIAPSPPTASESDPQLSLNPEHFSSLRRRMSSDWACLMGTDPKWAVFPFGAP